MGRPLPLNTLKARPLTYVLYWAPRHGPDAFQNGHSALIIDSQAFFPTSTDYYVSWMGGGGGMNPFVRSAADSDFVSDSMSWGGHKVGTLGKNRVPTRWVALKDLNMADMKQEWDTMRTKQNAHWKLVDKNCATSVARILKAGGGDSFATAAKSQAIWWPTDLIRYAKSMGASVVDQS